MNILKSIRRFWSRTRLASNRTRCCVLRYGRPSRWGRIEALESREVFSTDFLSVLSMGGDIGSSHIADFAVDAIGNRYVVGDYSGTVDFDTAASPGDGSDTLMSAGNSDFFVAKYSSADELLWIRSWGGGLRDAGTDISLAANGRVIVTGTFGDVVGFGTTVLTAAGNSDGVVASLNATDGAIQWVRQWGTSNNEFSPSLAVDGTGTAYVTSNAAAGGILYPSVELSLRKYDATGATIWTKNLQLANAGPTDNSTINDVVFDPSSGGFVIVGTVDGIVDFDPTSKTNAVRSLFNTAYAAKYDSLGRLKWVSPFYGSTANSIYGRSQGSSVAVDNVGNVVVGGTYVGPVDFNPAGGTTWLQGNGGFVAKLKPTGSLSWAKALVETSTSSNTSVNSLQLDASGNIFAAGYFADTVDFDPGSGIVSRTSAGEWDIFAMSLSPTGQYRWTETIGGAGIDFASGLVLEPDGTIHLAGKTFASIDVDPTIGEAIVSASSGNSATFLSRWRRTN